MEHIVLPIGTTLDRFIYQNQGHFPYATGELSQLLRDISLAAKIVHREINRAGLVDITGSTNQENVQGEIQQKLDVSADVRFTKALSKGGEVCGIISEEHPEIIDTGSSGKYIIAIDPLDGSSNIDVNVSVGTIFSIFRRVSKINSLISKADVLQQGNKQVAAGYVLYGSSTMLIFTTGSGVNGFTYDFTLGEFILSHKDIIIPQNGTVYSCNEASSHHYPTEIQQYLEYCKENDYKSRYIGSLVADFHRNLLKGGVYLYPSTKNDPNGKLRLMYEANPLAYIVEQAGGAATNGNERILNINPENHHERTPLVIGSKKMVEKIQEFAKK